ncbi:MAG: HEAT repeat domain-containing protein [Deltaproteobacteria bacterium]|nr:HEAT repeat domain-containing protein [Deltaproteobacteria bacterium]MBN2673123.1 HEAT repeat domain-containing protein [Deltaproteobacteria bacterium]
MNASKILSEILALDAKIMTMQDDFDAQPETDKQSALVELASKLLSETGPNDSVPIPMIRVAEMICTLEDGPEQLAKALSHENEDVRHLFGEAIISLGTEDGVASISAAVDYALTHKGKAALEMPFILAWIDDPGVTEYIHKFLEVEDTEIVYAAIEACASVSDEDSIPSLKKLLDDTRQVEVDDDDENDDQPVTIGMLAQEAIEIIESAEE